MLLTFVVFVQPGHANVVQRPAEHGRHQLLDELAYLDLLLQSARRGNSPHWKCSIIHLLRNRFEIIDFVTFARLGHFCSLRAFAGGGFLRLPARRRSEYPVVGLLQQIRIHLVADVTFPVTAPLQPNPALRVRTNDGRAAAAVRRSFTVTASGHDGTTANRTGTQFS